ncbi:alpha/beta hydrolase, partial [Vibrio sp. 10N.222.55.C12]
AAYPHIKGDNLSIQAQVLANKAYEEASHASKYVFKQLNVPYKGKTVQANLHLPHTERPLPVVIVCAGLDSVQTDMWKLFLDHLAPNEFAMLTI